MSPAVGYVLSSAFSGSTLLSFLLDDLPDVACVGEVTDVIDSVADKAGYPCSCGKAVRDCDFWQAVSGQMELRGFHFGAEDWNLRFHRSRRFGSRGWLKERLTVRSLHNLTLDAWRDAAVSRLPRTGPAIREIALRNQALVQSVLQVTGKSVFVDGSKDPRRVALLRDLAGFTDPFVIHLLRDPVGFVASATGHGHSFERSILVWRTMMRHCEHLQEVTPPERWLNVRYEDLCQDTTSTMSAVAKVCGSRLPAVPVVLGRTGHHVRGNMMRLDQSTTIALDTRWQDRLTPEQLRVVCDKTKRYRQELGYPELDSLLAGLSSRLDEREADPTAAS